MSVPGRLMAGFFLSLGMLGLKRCEFCLGYEIERKVTNSIIPQFQNENCRGH